MESKGVLFEFPPETIALVDKLADRLKLSREQVISKGLGLLDVWAKTVVDDHGKIVERSSKGEFEIDIYA